MTYNFARLRDELENGNLDALREAGLLKPHTAQFLEDYRQNYEPESAPHYRTGEPAFWYYNTETYVNVVRRNLNETLYTAVKQGNMPVIERAMGLKKSEQSQPGIDFLDSFRLANMLERKGETWIFAGGRGTGKTSTTLRFIELLRVKYRDKLRVFSNMRSFAENYEWVTYGDSDRDLLDWAEDVDPSYEKYAVLDEMSSKATGVNSQDVYDSLNEFLMKIRKEPYRLSIFAIGHRPSSLHPVFRDPELSTIIRKKDKKTAIFYESESMQNDILTLEGIKDTTLDWSTNDHANWEFVIPDEEEGGGEDDEIDPADLQTCAAETNEGNPCSADPWKGLDYCYNHRHLAMQDGDETESDGNASEDEGAETDAGDETPEIEPADREIPDDIDLEATGMDAVEEIARITGMDADQALETYNRAAERIETDGDDTDASEEGADA